jgi:hypothetical protein
MNPMTLILVAAIASAIVLIRSIASRHGRTRYVRRSLLTKSELRFFDQLIAAVPEGHFVFPQVGMAAAMEPHGGSAQAVLAAFRRISQKRIDFCICDLRLDPQLVVELDDHTYDPARDRAREALLLQAGIRTLRFDVRRSPTASELRACLSQAQLGDR